jgi:hypothetical protein
MWRMTPRFFAPAFLALTVLVLPSSVLAQKSNLLVTAAVTPRTVSQDGLVQLEARIQNDAKSKAVVLRGEPGWTAEGGVSVRITDTSGNARVIRADLGGLSAAETREGSRKTVLKPGEGVSITRQLAAAQLFPRAGNYTVVITYRSPQPSNGNRSVNPDDLEGEAAQSEPITVVVN